jgi:hypothetical protein
MTDLEKLVTAARHYCLDNFTYWSDKYAREKSGQNNPYSEHDYNLFPRYLIQKALLQDIESVVCNSFSSFEEGQKKLIEFGKNILFENILRSPDPIALKALQDEQSKFISFIDSLTVHHVSNIAPLPYRYKLPAHTAADIRTLLAKRWHYDGSYWNPLVEKSFHETLFLNIENLSEEDRHKIAAFLIQKADPKLYEITEEQVDYEIDFDSLDLQLYETVLTDRSMDWIIYGSHESTITFGGAWLLPFIKELFADRPHLINEWEKRSGDDL